MGNRTMKEIKTADEVLNEHGVQIFGAQEKRIKAAMRAYAEQFIELAADEAQVDCDYLPNRDRLSYSVDRQSILKLKEHLK